MGYGIGFVNKTGRHLDRVSLYRGNKMWAFPTPVVVGGLPTQGIFTSTIPAEAELIIQEHGENKSFKVSLRDVPKWLRKATIYFVINKDGAIQAKALKDNDLAGYSELIKGLRPAGEYGFAFVNRTGRDLQSVFVTYGDQVVGSCVEVPGLSKANFGYSDLLTTPCPAEAELRWIEESTTNTAKVMLTNVPKGFEGRIFFTFKAEGRINVDLVKIGDDKSAFELVR